MTFSPKIPYGGKATAIFGLILIAVFWVGTSQRGSAEAAEARATEFSKNANLALALDVHRSTARRHRPVPTVDEGPVRVREPADYWPDARWPDYTVR